MQHACSGVPKKTWRKMCCWERQMKNGLAVQHPDKWMTFAIWQKREKVTKLIKNWARRVQIVWYGMKTLDTSENICIYFASPPSFCPTFCPKLVKKYIVLSTFLRERFIEKRRKKTYKCQFCPYTYLRTVKRDIFLFFSPICHKMRKKFCRLLAFFSHFYPIC